MESFVNYLNSKTPSPADIKKHCKTFGIMVSFKKEGEDLIKILLYTKDNAKITLDNNLANGAIFELVDGIWHQVCFPLPNRVRVFPSQLRGRNSFDVKFLKKNPELKYDIFEVFDGTVINVYYSILEKRFVFSTRKLFDVTGVVWRGFSYDEMLNGTDLTEILNLGYPTSSILISDPRWHSKSPGRSEKVLGVYTGSEYRYCDPLPLEINEVAKRILNDVNTHGTSLLGYTMRTVSGLDFFFPTETFLTLESVVYKLGRIDSKELREFGKTNFMKFPYVVARAYLLNQNPTSIFVNWTGHFNMICAAELKVFNFCTKTFKSKKFNPVNLTDKFALCAYGFWTKNMDKFQGVSNNKTFASILREVGGIVFYFELCELLEIKGTTETFTASVLVSKQKNTRRKKPVTVKKPKDDQSEK